MVSVSEFYVLIGVAFVVLFIITAHCLYCAICSKIDEQREMAMEVYGKHLELQKVNQEWLFNQLYTIKPGAILRPDEVGTEEKSQPAMVYNPTEDVMSEFSGLKDDWHG